MSFPLLTLLRYALRTERSKLSREGNKGKMRKIENMEGSSKLSLPLYFTSFLPPYISHTPFHRSVNPIGVIFSRVAAVTKPGSRFLASRARGLLCGNYLLLPSNLWRDERATNFNFLSEHAPLSGEEKPRTKTRPHWALLK
jgi:hypothetical protein